MGRLIVSAQMTTDGVMDQIEGWFDEQGDAEHHEVCGSARPGHGSGPGRGGGESATRGVGDVLRLWGIGESAGP